MPSIIEKIQAKIELFRLEQRYTRNRHRRSGFISNAVYVDGEYVYQTPNNTGSSTHSSSTPSSPIDGSRRHNAVIEDPSKAYTEPQTPVQKKRLSRLSSMPGFGSSKSSPRDWRSSAVDVRDVR
ncbi:hypothetical protein GGR54DRAFT_644854 [Hypoxylon sp. NC1633]|nr:hypothetical protein GGR54DRAFT_644854 [Hypoxylon sp. NC1633]